MSESISSTCKQEPEHKSIVYAEYSCSACDTKIGQQKRYVCLICDNYNLCEPCYGNKRYSGEHRPNHPMQPVLHKVELLRKETIVPEIGNLSCPRCSDKRMDWSDFQSHYDRYHKGTKRGPERCPICLVCNVSSTEKHLDLSSHINSKHFKKSCSLCSESISQDVWYACSDCVDLYVCKKCFNARNTQLNHEAYHSMQLCRSSGYLYDYYGRDYKRYLSFACPYCGDKEFTVQKLIEHCEEYHHDDKTIRVQCTVCLALRYPYQLQEETLVDHLRECHIVK